MYSNSYLYCFNSNFLITKKIVLNTNKWKATNQPPLRIRALSRPKNNCQVIHCIFYAVPIIFLEVLVMEIYFNYILVRCKFQNYKKILKLKKMMAL